jgi:phage N-6-adenine-methyltransferase
VSEEGIVSFIARNHPQQVGKRGALSFVDDRMTDPEVFQDLDDRFKFTVDAAATWANTLLPRFWTIEDDALAQSWAGERVWCNPPFSDIRPWVDKAWNEWLSPDPPEVIVMLLPANRTEQAWWQDLVEPDLRDRLVGFRVEFLRGRMRFIAPGDTAIKPNARPPFGCCLLIWRTS